MKTTYHPKILAMSEDERRAWAARTGRKELPKEAPKAKPKKKGKK